MEDISPFCGVTDTSVLDFWWRLLWVSKLRGITHLYASSPVSSGFLRFTSDTTFADLLTARKCFNNDKKYFICSYERILFCKSLWDGITVVQPSGKSRTTFLSCHCVPWRLTYLTEWHYTRFSWYLWILKTLLVAIRPNVSIRILCPRSSTLDKLIRITAELPSSKFSFLLLQPANEVWAKVIFSEACVKNSVHRVGSASVHAQIPASATPPPPRTRQAPPGQALSGTRQAPSPETRASSPSRTKHPPTPEQSMLGDMVNEWMVCILLECNLVHSWKEPNALFCDDLKSGYSLRKNWTFLASPPRLVRSTTDRIQW